MKEYNILGSSLGPLILGNYHFTVLIHFFMPSSLALNRWSHARDYTGDYYGGC